MRITWASAPGSASADGRRSASAGGRRYSCLVRVDGRQSFYAGFAPGSASTQDATVNTDSVAPAAPGSASANDACTRRDVNQSRWQ